VLEAIDQGSVEFEKAIDDCVVRFRTNALCRAIDEGRCTSGQYVRLLQTLHGQVLSSPITFAIAATHCNESRAPLRSYLLRHAAEEDGHYRWIEDDLRSIGAFLEPMHGMPIVT